MTLAELLTILKRLKVVRGVKAVSDFGITIPLIVMAQSKDQMIKLAGTTIIHDDVEWELLFQPKDTIYTDKRTGLPKPTPRDKFVLACQISKDIDDLADVMSG